MLTNPFLEGFLLILLGVVTTTLGGIFKIEALTTAGPPIITFGLGYMGGNKIGGQK